jgi:hypothetical protein
MEIDNASAHLSCIYKTSAHLEINGIFYPNCYSDLPTSFVQVKVIPDVGGLTLIKTTLISIVNKTSVLRRNCDMSYSQANTTLS